MLCQYCRDINFRQLFEQAEPLREPPRHIGFSFFPKPPATPFYSSRRAIFESSRAGCELCTAFATGLASKGYGPERMTEQPEQLYVIIPVRNDEMSMVGIAARSVNNNYHPMCKLRVVQLRGYPHLQYLGIEYTSVPRGPQNAIHFVAFSLKVCLSRHTLCNVKSKGVGSMPTRVIDIGLSDQSCSPQLLSPRLLITGGMTGSWVALSYRWGTSVPFVLTKGNLDQLTAGFSLSDLPQTLSDAIQIVYNMGQRYIWIDALCIIQDSPEDWNAEAATMRYVYSNAIATLSAAASVDSSVGMLLPRGGRLQCPLRWDPVLSPSEDVAVEYGLEPGVTERALHSYDSLLAGRGWCFQEALLSTRNAVFLQNYALWECAAVSHQEGHQQGESRLGEGSATTNSFYFQAADLIRLLHPSQNRDDKIENHFSSWCAIVTAYTGTELTVDADILPALGGLAQEFNAVKPDRYYAGMWEKDFVFYMLWVRNYDGTRSELVKRPSTFLAPSWSWASIRGPPVKFYLRDTQRRSRYNFSVVAKVHKIAMMPSKSQNFGKVEGGAMTIQSQFQILDLSSTDILWTSSPQEDQEEANQILESLGISSSELHGTALFRNSSVPRGYVQSSRRTTLESRVATELRLDLIRRSHEYDNGLEFLQQFRPIAGCHFAALQLVRYSKKLFKGSMGSNDDYPGKQGVFILILQSTERENEYRRVGLILVVDGLDQWEQQMNRCCTDYREIMKERWEKKTIVII